MYRFYIYLNRNEAYFDRPFKRQQIHISAPHMYITILESLDLKPGMAFLNIGSGSGYLNCLVTYLLRGEGKFFKCYNFNSFVYFA